jgi:hypothetical protein
MFHLNPLLSVTWIGFNNYSLSQTYNSDFVLINQLVNYFIHGYSSIYDTNSKKWTGASLIRLSTPRSIVYCILWLSVHQPNYCRNPTY